MLHDVAAAVGVVANVTDVAVAAAAFDAAVDAAAVIGWHWLLLAVTAVATVAT